MNSKSLKFDGTIQDMGSDVRNIVHVPIIFKGKGTESEIREFAAKNIDRNVRVIEDKVYYDADGNIVYEAQTECMNGIPGSFKSGGKNSVVLFSVPSVQLEASVCSFGDISLGNPCSFGDI